MTYNVNCTLSDEILEQIAEQGLEFLPELIRIVINAAMQAERQAYLGLAPYERSPVRLRSTSRRCRISRKSCSSESSSSRSLVPSVEPSSTITQHTGRCHWAATDATSAST